MISRTLHSSRLNLAVEQRDPQEIDLQAARKKSHEYFLRSAFAVANGVSKGGFGNMHDISPYKDKLHRLGLSRFF